MSTAAPHPAGAFTVLRVDGIATKRMKWTGGSEVAIHPAPNLGRGSYRVEVAGSVDQLRNHIERLSTAETLVWGLPVHSAGDFITKPELAKLNGSAPATTISRTREHFAYAPTAGWMMLDFDYVPAGATLDLLRDMLVSVASGLAGVPMLGMSSASANIFLKANRQPLRGLTGARFYLSVAEAYRIPELGRRLFDRLILAGHGRADISKTGQVLFRTPVDGAVWQPERVDYAAGAHVEPLLEQRREMTTWNADASTHLDDVVLPPLIETERTRLGIVIAKIRAGVKDQAVKVRAAYMIERAAAGHAVSWAEVGDRIVLEASHEIVLTGGERVTVDEILSDPGRFHGMECADPLEPDYNNDGRIAVIRTDKPPNIFSHAHGGQLYLLRPSQDVVQGSAQETFDADPNAAQPPEVPPVIAEMNEKYVVVPDGIYCTVDGVIRSPAQVWQYLASEQGLFAQWNTHLQRARASRVVFDPDLPPLAIAGDVLNTYPGMALTSDSGASCARLLDHIHTIICDGDREVSHWVMSWLAHIAQRPKVKCGTALVLKGLEGAGKSVIGSVMQRVLGRELTANISKRDQLLGRFNGHLQPLLFVEAAEAVWHKDVQAFGVLKDLITAHEMTFENKGQRAYSAPSFARILFTSNERVSVPVTANDRRFTVLLVSDEVAKHRPGRSEYWAALWDEVNSGGDRAFLHTLLTYPVDEELIRRPLQTSARREEQAENLDPLMRWLVSLAETPPTRLELDAELEPGEFRTDDLHASYMASIRGTNEGRYPANKIAFSRWLTSLSGRGLHIGIGLTHGRSDRKRTRQFPPLPILREWLQPQAAMPEWDMGEQWDGVDK